MPSLRVKFTSKHSNPSQKHFANLLFLNFMKQIFTHPFKPIFDENSKILILGSFPSVKSRQAEFYYAHPRNRFWQVLAEIFNEPVPEGVSQKCKFLLNNRVAIYDAAFSCSIKGSLDANMQNEIPADLSKIFKKAKIKAVFANGNKAYKICQKFHTQIILHHTGKSVIKLPSSSPANAKFSLENLIKEWQQILL